MSTIKRILCSIWWAFFIWVLLSWGDIVVDNNHPSPQTQDWNLFEIVFAAKEDTLRWLNEEEA